MKVYTIYQNLTKLQKEIDQHGQLSKEVLQKINYKFRLDWNYYSNRMEGGTLTKAETRSVMVGNITVDGKPLKDVMEMNGHDAVVRSILSMAKGALRLSEKRIKEIHREIIKHDDAATADQPIGDWKTKNNEIINYKGEKIAFTPPDEVADAIHKLLNTTNAALDAFYADKPKAKHPLQIAADFHIGFVSIHPFFDGNGRTARILMNLILVACGYPPIIIDDAAKKPYYQYLADIQAYGGNPDLFYGQMGQLVLKSQQLVLNAITGKDIEEDDDLDKRLDLIKRAVETDGGIKLSKKDVDPKVFMEQNIQPLIKMLNEQFEKLEPLFIDNSIGIAVDSNQANAIDNYKNLKEFADKLSENWSKSSNYFNVFIYHAHIKQAGINKVQFIYPLYLRMEKTGFTISDDNQNKPIIHKLYHQHLTETEIKSMAKDYLKNGLDHIEASLKHMKNDGK